MPLFKYLKNLKSFSVIIVPDDTSHEARSKKLTITKIFIFVIIYSILVSVLGYYFFSVTRIGYNVLPGNLYQRTENVEKIEQLNQKVIFLAKELQQLRSANQRLKYAIALGDSTLADSFKVSLDTLQKFYKIPKEGNILGALVDYISQLFVKQDKTIFFISPVYGFISREFDPERGHFGIDFVVKDGSPVYATAGGFVVFSGYTNDYGHLIILSHSDGYLSIYKHCSVILKKERDFIKQGELIAQSGNSGLATTGPHLHFELWHNGKPIDPQSLININNK